MKKAGLEELAEYYELKQSDEADYWKKLKGIAEVSLDYTHLVTEQEAIVRAFMQEHLTDEVKSPEQVAAAFKKIRDSFKEWRVKREAETQ